MDLRYINPFVASAVSVIDQAVGITARKKQIYIAKGKESLGGVSIFFNIIGDVEGQIIFDLPPGISTVIAKEMVGLNLQEVVDDDENKELFKSAITELGNMISGNAITRLEEHKFNCDITPPQVYVGPKTKLTHPSMSTIVIEMNTVVGDFSINLVNKKDHYLDSIHMLAIKLTESLTIDLVHEFLPKGFYVYSCQDIESWGKYYLREKKIDFVLIDIDPFAEKIEDSINDMRAISKNENTKFILYSSIKDPEFLKRVQQTAVSGFLLKGMNLAQLMGKLQNIFSRLGVNVSERRKQVISKISSEDKFKVNINNTELNIRTAAEIKELSVGGLTFVPEDSDMTKKFAEQLPLKDLQLNLKGK